MFSILLYLTRYVLVSRSSLMLEDPVMNTSKATFLLFFCILLAMYLYNALIECSCYVKKSVHISLALHRGIFLHIFKTMLRSMYHIHNR